MGITLLLVQLTRAVVLQGGLCTGDEINPVPPTCVRIEGNARCNLPGDLRVEARAIFIQWPEGNASIRVTATGQAHIVKGRESFSADDARLVISHPETKPLFTHV